MKDAIIEDIFLVGIILIILGIILYFFSPQFGIGFGCIGLIIIFPTGWILRRRRLKRAIRRLKRKKVKKSNSRT